MISSIQDYLRVAAARGRDTARIGPFLATFSRSSTNPFLNYAIPNDGAKPRVEEVAGLIEAYQRRGLRPRLEYLTTCAPEVEEPLLAAGFTVEGRLALMTCQVGDARTIPVPEGIELVQPQTDRELLDTRTMENEAYETPEIAGQDDVQGLAASVQAGGMAVLARVEGTGEPVGAGEYTAPVDGFTEITSVGVRSAFRRRGIAAAITAWLLQSAFDAGVTSPFLMANEAEERIYARTGFHTTSRILHISRYHRGCGNRSRCPRT